jgi:hypothetical protein
MAFLLRLLERKESLIEVLKEYNSECSNRLRQNPEWRPDENL